MAHHFDNPKHDPWESMWQEGVSRGEYFDKWKALPELVKQIENGTISRGQTAFVPGCGRGYDVEALSRCGLFSKVIGMDISTTGAHEALEYLKSVDPKLPQIYDIVQGDFFDAQLIYDPFCLVYDYTFFCAIPLERRKEWAQRMKSLVRKGGSLITVMYPVGKDLAEGGPPFGTDPKAYEELLEGEGGFERRDGPRLVDDNASHEGREGRTWWCRWERV
ncbi:thiol methyltransferase 2 [Gracilaria domingensis]|nr:thiol methyltransferase 2 [Gracilaria domingensis]